MADDYRRHKMNYCFVPSLLSDVGRAKAFVRPTKSEKIMTGLGAIFNVVDALEQERQMEILFLIMNKHPIYLSVVTSGTTLSVHVRTSHL